MPRSCRATFEACRVAGGDNAFRLTPMAYGLESVPQLESFIVTLTRFEAVKDRGLSLDEWAERHVLFMRAQCRPALDALELRVL